MGHRFSYRVMSLLIDLDRLAEAGPAIAAVRRQPRGALQFPRGRPWRARRLVRCAPMRSVARPSAASTSRGGRVLLLCYPRLLGYTFNPLSVYFCYRADGELALLIYEVRNTFGDIHPYVLPVTSGEISDAGVRQQQDKLFYVSPFIEMAMRYHFRVLPPGERVQAAHSGNRPRRPPARRNLQWPPSRAQHQGVAARVLRPPAGHHEDHGGDPLGGAAALAEGRAAGAAERTQPAIPAWRAGKATIILRRRCPPVPRIEAGSIDHARSG